MYVTKKDLRRILRETTTAAVIVLVHDERIVLSTSKSRLLRDVQESEVPDTGTVAKVKFGAWVALRGGKRKRDVIITFL